MKKAMKRDEKKKILRNESDSLSVVGKVTINEIRYLRNKKQEHFR